MVDANFGKDRAGLVQLLSMVSAQGKPYHAIVAASSGDPKLDEGAVATWLDALTALKRALLDNRAVVCLGCSLPSRERTSLQLAAFELEVSLGQYREALSSWNRIKMADIDDDDEARFAAAVANIKHMRDTRIEYSITGELGNNDWLLDVLEPQFSISSATRAALQVRLYCQGGYAHFSLDPKFQYAVPPAYGECTLAILGKPGTRFTVEQF